MSLQITESGDELDYFLPLKRRMVVPLQMMLCPNRPDENFTFFDPTRLCLYVTGSVRSGERRERGGLNHLLFRFEATVFIHCFHVGFPDAAQLVLKVLEVTRFGPPLLLPFNNMFVKVIQPLHDLLVGTYSGERSAGEGKH